MSGVSDSATSPLSNKSSSLLLEETKCNQFYHIQSEAELEEAVARPGLTVVDFYSTECKPCQGILPHMVKIAKHLSKIQFLAVEANQFPKLHASYEIQKVPTFKIFKTGKEVAEILGANLRELVLEIQKQEELSSSR